MQTKDLNAITTLIKPLVSQRYTLPVLSHVRLQAIPGRTDLDISGTNLEVFFKVSLPHGGVEGFDALVDLKDFSERIKSIGKSVEFEHDQALYLKGAGGIRAKLDTLPLEEWPPFPFGEDGQDEAAGYSVHTYGLRADLLLPALRRLLRFVSVDEARPVLTGIRFLLDGTSARLEAADGFRLLSETYPDLIIGTAETPPADFLLPPATARLLLRLEKFLAGTGIIVRILAPDNPKDKQNRAEFYFRDNLGRTWRINTTTIEGTYPDFASVVLGDYPAFPTWSEITTERHQHVDFQTAPLTATLSAIKAANGKETLPARFIFTAEKPYIAEVQNHDATLTAHLDALDLHLLPPTVTNRDKDTGRKEEIANPASWVRADRRADRGSFAFNAAYLLDAVTSLTELGADRVRLYQSHPFSPFVVEGFTPLRDDSSNLANQPDRARFIIIMPMHD